MKTKIFIYLFVFTALILVFQLVNSFKVVKYQAEIIAEKVARIDTLKVSLENISSKYDDDVYFSLDQNDEAKAFQQYALVRVLTAGDDVTHDRHDHHASVSLSD